MGLQFHFHPGLNLVVAASQGLTSSATASSLNRSLWYAIGKAWRLAAGLMTTAIQRFICVVRSSTQRDPRWGRNDNSPGDDPLVQAEYGVAIVRGGQGALQNGSYPLGEYRKAIHEMKQCVACVVLLLR